MNECLNFSLLMDEYIMTTNIWSHLTYQYNVDGLDSAESYLGTVLQGFFVVFCLIQAFVKIFFFKRFRIY